MQEDLENDRLEFIQEVIDRLIYLSPEDKKKYRAEIEKLHTKYNIGAEEINGIRTINNRINGEAPICSIKESKSESEPIKYYKL